MSSRQPVAAFAARHDSNVQDTEYRAMPAATKSGATVSMREIARVAGVSRTAVYHVVNNRTGEVSDDTRERILKSMREMGYTPPPRVTQRDERNIEIVGCVITASAPHLTQPGYYRKMLDSILLASEPHSINLTLFTGDLFSVDTSEKVRLYCDGRCDGMLLTALRVDSTLPAILAERGTPFAIIGSRSNFVDGYTIDIDNEHAITTLVKHLLEHGHRRIAFCPGPNYIPSAFERNHAFHRCAAEFGFHAVTVAGLENTCEPEQWPEWTERILSLPEGERPTAIVGWNDGSALVAVEQAQKMGLEVPADVSAVGIDDIEDFSNAAVALTSYRQPCGEIAEAAVAFLRRQFQPGFEPGNVLVKGTLSVRASVAPPREAQT